MDQEKFDQHLMDYLFDELDEVTRAAMRQKIDTDAECRELEAGLRATLVVSQLPLEEPSDDLEERILAATALAQHSQPWHQKLLRSLSWAGSHAMRPQLAMAAVLVLVLGSSVLLLRARPGAMPVTPSRDVASRPTAPDKGRGAAAADDQRAELPSAAATAEVARALASAAASPSPSAAKLLAKEEQKALDEQYRRGIDNFRAGNHSQAQSDLGAVSQSSSRHAASAALYQARAVRAHTGCGAAVPHYANVRQRFGGAGVAADATWEQADCHRLLGQKQEARALWLALKSNPAYKSRAVTELSSGTPTGGSGKGAVAHPKMAAPRRMPAPKPAAPTQAEETNSDSAL